MRVAIPTPASLPELAQRRPEPPAEASPEVTESMITRIEPTSGPKAPPKPPESALEVTESMITRLPDLPDLPASPKPRKTSLGPLPKLPPRKS